MTGVPEAALAAARWDTVRSVLFDWNGTLVDDTARAVAATAELVAELGIGPPPTADSFAAGWRLPVRAYLRDLGVAGVDLIDAERRWNALMGAQCPPLRAGAHVLLAELRDRGLEVGIVSGALPALLVADLTHHGLAGMVDLVHAGIDDKASVLRAHTGGTRGTLVYVGDTEADIAAAASSGAVPVAVAGGYRPVEALVSAGAVLVLRDLTDLLALVG